MHLAGKPEVTNSRRSSEREISPVTAAFGRAYDGFLHALGIIAASMLLVLPLLITIDVAMRMFRLGSIKWILDVSEYALFLSTYLGAPWLMRLGLHVRVDVLLSAIRKNIARRVEQALDLFCFGICSLLAYYGLAAAIDAYRLGLKQYKSLTIPDWPFHVIFVFSMVLLAIEFVRRMRRPDEALVHDPSQGLP